MAPRRIITDAAKASIVNALADSPIRFATVARIYEAPNYTQWSYTGLVGYLALVQMGDCFYLKLLDLNTYALTWQHELYNNFVLRMDASFFHSFDGDHYPIGISYTDEEDANRMFSRIRDRGAPKAPRRAAPAPPPAGRPRAPAPSTPSTPSAPSPSSPAPSAPPPRTVSATSSSSSKSSSATAKKKKGKISREDIGLPSNFRHISHVGWSAESGFEARNIPQQWKEIFKSAGLREEDLQDEETANIVMDFMKKYGDAPAVSAPAAPAPAPAAPPSRAGPPPPPPSSRGAPPPPPASRGAPPPPPPSRGGPPPPPPSRGGPPPPPSRGGPPPPPPPSGAPPPAPSYGGYDEPAYSPMPPTPGAPPPPPPAAGGGGPPPPPPPPPPGDLAPPPPSLPTPNPGGNSLARQQAANPRAGLLDAIKGHSGVAGLKHAADRELPAPPPQDNNTADGIANALRAALASRQTAMRGASSDEDEDEAEDEDDDW